jgi:phytoene dehydrogenase-like protein
MGAVTAALRSAAVAAGARVHTEAPVARIDGGSGIVLEDGREVEARVVLSNADPVRTARFAEVCPGLPDRIVERLVLGPKQLEERFGITGGHIFHGEMLGERPGARRFGGVEGLYLAGSGAHPGGAVSGAPGYLAAQAVLEDLA